MPFLKQSYIFFANPKLHEAYKISKKIFKITGPYSRGLFYAPEVYYICKSTSRSKLSVCPATVQCPSNFTSSEYTLKNLTF